MTVRTPAVGAGVMALALVAAACAPATNDADVATPAATTITVAAAASLTDVFASIGPLFTEESGIEVRFSFAGSSTIAEQIRGGAPLDVFASAGATAIEPLAAEDLVTSVADFASNTLAIAVPLGNPGGVADLADLARVSVVVCAEQVPCGVAATTLFEQNALAVRPVSFEPDVRAVLTKIETDEADAGIVYATDVVARAGRVDAVAIPATDNVRSTYQAAVVTASGQAAAAAAFVAFLAGPQAQAALAEAGFGPPP